MLSLSRLQLIILGVVSLSVMQVHKAHACNRFGWEKFQICVTLFNNDPLIKKVTYLVMNWWLNLIVLILTARWLTSKTSFNRSLFKFQRLVGFEVRVSKVFSDFCCKKILLFIFWQLFNKHDPNRDLDISSESLNEYNENLNGPEFKWHSKNWPKNWSA